MDTSTSVGSYNVDYFLLTAIDCRSGKMSSFVCCRFEMFGALGASLRVGGRMALPLR